MIILGIDTALRCTGYGVIEYINQDKIAIVDCGVIKTPASALHSECLRRLAGGIRELVGRFHPDEAAIEGAFFHKNIKTAMILSYARGSVMTVLAETGIPAFVYAPRKAKQAICGRGSASKEQVAFFIASRLGLDIKKVPLDLTDALAIALCHGQNSVNPLPACLKPERI